MLRVRLIRPAAFLLALVLGTEGAPPAFAQGEAGGAPGQGAASEGGLPEAEPDLVPLPTAPPPGIEAIEVTGERLDSANVQDEAQAITAFSGADLDKANIVNVDSLQFNVPGLHVGQSGQAPIITLRGIGTENASLTGEPGVAFHVDGINLSRPAAARVAFFDLETLEVKRGPQGLTGGKNSTSGHINLISNKPRDEFEVTGDVLFGNYDRVRIRGALNVPLGEYAASRLALYHEGRDGFLDNAFLSDSHDPFDADDFGLRGQLALRPADTVEWLIRYNYFKQDGAGPQADIVPIPSDPDCLLATGEYLHYATMPNQAACFNRQISKEDILPGDQTSTHPGSTLIYLGGQPYTQVPEVNEWQPAVEDGDPRTVYPDVASDQRNRYWGWSTNLEWDAPALPALGETHVRLLGGYQRTESTFNQDFDATSAPLSSFWYDDVADQYSGELQWTGTGLVERLEWQLSLFHQHEKAERELEAPGITDESGGLVIEQATNNKAYGAALHGSYQLTDSLRYRLGGRFIKDSKENHLLREAFAASDSSHFRGCAGNLGIVGIPVKPERPNPACNYVDRQFMWGTGFEWTPLGDDHLFYANLDRGAKTGGFRAGTVGEYAPEKIWAYALGSKSQFFDQRLTVNLEGFVYNYQDLQIVVIDGAALRTENTDARMYGWDLEALASPIDGLNLSAVVSYLHTETIDYYSLDTANPDQYQISRLENRDLADAYEAQGITIPNYQMLTCLTPENPTGEPCGTLPDKGGLYDYSDNQLSRSPQWKATLSGEYEVPLGRYGSLTPRVQYTWQDDTYFRAFNQDFDLQDDYHLTDAKVTWRSPEDRWSVEVFVQNIEDEAPKQNILIGPRYFGSPVLAWYGPPRFYGVQVGFKY